MKRKTYRNRPDCKECHEREVQEAYERAQSRAYERRYNAEKRRVKQDRETPKLTIAEAARRMLNVQMEPLR